MASGSLIYVGKSRLRRKYRKQKIENRIRRKERRRQQREAQRQDRENSTETKKVNAVDTINNNNNNTTNNDNNNDCNNNPDLKSESVIRNQKNNGVEQHICRFCENFDCPDCDSFGSIASIEAELVPLIGAAASYDDWKKQFRTFWKKEKKGKEKLVGTDLDDVNNNYIKDETLQQGGKNDEERNEDNKERVNGTLEESHPKQDDPPEKWEDVMLAEDPRVVIDESEIPASWNAPLNRKMICAPCCVIM